MVARKNKQWIQKAVKRPGAFTKKANQHGKSVQSYARYVLKKGVKASKLTKQQARLAQTFRKIGKKDKKRKLK